MQHKNTAFWPQKIIKFHAKNKNLTSLLIDWYLFVEFYLDDRSQIKALGYVTNAYTLSPISLSGLSTIRYKTTLNTGSVGWAGAAPPTCELGKFLSWPLALSMSTYSNFQINGASGETLKPPGPRFLKQNRGLEVSEFLPKLHLFGNCYKSTYLEPRAMTKTSPVYK